MGNSKVLIARPRTKVIGKMTNLTASGRPLTAMALFTRALFLKEKGVEKASENGKMAISIMATGKITLFTEKASSSGPAKKKSILETG